MEIAHRGLDAGEFIYMLGGLVRQGAFIHLDGQVLEYSRSARNGVHCGQRLLSARTVEEECVHVEVFDVLGKWNELELGAWSTPPLEDCVFGDHV